AALGRTAGILLVIIGFICAVAAAGLLKRGLVACRRVIWRQCRRRHGADFYWRTGKRRIRGSNRRWICYLSNQIASQRVFRYRIRSCLNYFTPPSTLVLPAACRI